MRLLWAENGWEDYLYWQERDKNLLKRINKLIKDVMRSPYSGIGKPEPLKFDSSGKWSRRINDEHRLVYEIIGIKEKLTLIIYQCRYHY